MGSNHGERGGGGGYCWGRLMEVTLGMNSVTPTMPFHCHPKQAALLISASSHLKGEILLCGESMSVEEKGFELFSVEMRGESSD